MALTAFPVPTQTVSKGARLSGTGSPASPLNVPDGGIDNAALANMAASRYKGRLSSTGVPQDLTKVEVQGDLSIDDLIALSGVAEGAANLGTFTGTTIADSQTVKAALQALETAVESAGSGSSKSYDNPTAIDGVVCNLTRVGGSSITLSKPSTGHYRLIIPSGADLERGVVFFNNANVDGTTFYLEIDNSANSRDRFIVPYLQYGNTGAWADIVALGLAPTQNASGNVVTYQVNNANGNGANGFRLIFS